MLIDYVAFFNYSKSIQLSIKSIKSNQELGILGYFYLTIFNLFGNSLQELLEINTIFIK